MEELSKVPGVKVANPKGAFYCIAELPVANADDFAQWLLENFEYEGETVMVAASCWFLLNSGLGLNQIRIAYVLEKEKIVRAVRILQEALKAYNA